MTRHLVLVLVVGCAVDTDPPPEDLSPKLVMVELDDDSGPPIFMRYRNGSGAWQEPEVMGSRWMLRVHDRFELITVCGYDPRYITNLEATTFGESGDSVRIFCGRETELAPTVTVSGTMVQPGHVRIDSESREGLTPDWQFELYVESARHDLIAVGGDRMMIRRNLEITMDTTVPTVDVVIEGAVMPTVPLSITGIASGEVTTTSLWMVTSNGSMMLHEKGTTAHVMPPELKTATDHQEILFVVDGPTSTRGAKIDYDAGGTTAFTLLPRLEGVRFEAMRATWSTLPQGAVSLWVVGDSPMRFRASSKWLAGETELGFIDDDIPGYLPEWKPTQIDYQVFEVHTEQQPYLYTSVGTSSVDLAKQIARPALGQRRW